MANDNNDNNLHIGRRKLLRNATAASFGTVGVAGIATAHEEDESREVDTEVREADRPGKYVGITRRHQDFKILSDYFRHELGYVIPSSGYDAFQKYENGDRSFTVVEFSAKERGKKSEEGIKASIAAKIKNGSVVGVVGALEQYEDGRLGGVKRYSVVDGDVHVETADVDLDAGRISTETGNEISPQFFHPNNCKICREVYQVACDVGCGLNAAGMCLLAGFVTGPGGVVCLVIGAVVCSFISRHGCGPAAKPDCKEMGYC